MKAGCSFPLHDLHEIRPRLVSSFVMSCFPWGHTGFSGRIFFFFGCTRSDAQDFYICSKQGLLCNCSTLVFSPVLLLIRSQALGHSGSVVVAHWLRCPGVFAIFPNQISNACLQHWIKRENTLEGIWNAILLHETWHHGLLMRRLIEDCPLLQATSWDQDWFRFPSQVFQQHLDCPAMWLCSCLIFWNPH